MRRVYTIKKPRRAAVNNALEQMRATQEALGPELMARIKLLVGEIDPRALDALTRERVEENDNGEEIIDRKNNLMVVMKFLQIKQSNKDLQSRVRAILSETDTFH